MALVLHFIHNDEDSEVYIIAQLLRSLETKRTTRFLL